LYVPTAQLVQPALVVGVQPPPHDWPGEHTMQEAHAVRPKLL
jgi:hypothetical protein